MPTATPTLTLTEFAALPAAGGRPRELDEGRLVEMTFPRTRHAFAASAFYDALNPWVVARSLGRCFIEAGFVVSADPPTLRAPDVAFVRQERLETADLDGWFEGAPDLAVEIVSPSDSAEELLRKIAQYLRGGSRAVLAVYPSARQILVHRPGGSIRLLGEDDALELPELFPGWSAPVAGLI